MLSALMVHDAAGPSGSGGIMSMSGPMWMPTDPPTLGRLLEFHPQPIPFVPLAALVGALAYLYGVLVLHRRGVSWPFGRTVAWMLGILVVEVVTATGIEGYGMMLFSVHMAQHMALAMIAPILLVVGSPVTLLLRTLPATGRGSGVRRTLAKFLGSRFLSVLSSVPVRWFLFLSALYGIYFTALFDDLMHSVWGHNLMLVHFILTGMLFFGPLVSSDPWPHRHPPFQRLLESFASTPFHAFFGIAIMTATTPIVGFFTDPPPSWHVDLMNDQNLAGGIAWATSELPTILVGALIMVSWLRSDAREARRHDRAEARSDDAELRAYNAYLASLASAELKQRRPGDSTGS